MCAVTPLPEFGTAGSLPGSVLYPLLELADSILLLVMLGSVSGLREAVLRGLLCFYKFPDVLVAALDAFVENQAEIPEQVFNQ